MHFVKPNKRREEWEIRRGVLMFSSRHVCLVLRLPLWLSWRPDESQRSSRKHLWWCENTTQQQCIIPTYYILNNVLDPWCWQNTVSWRFDCDRLTDFRWRAVIRDPLNPFYRTDSHSTVWLQAADRSSDRNITSELNQYKGPDLVLHHSNSILSKKKTHKNTKKTQLTKLQMIFNVNSSCHNCENPTWCRQKQEVIHFILNPHDPE